MPCPQNRLRCLALACVLLAGLEGCASGEAQLADGNGDALTGSHPGDPYEATNRGSLDSNLAVYDHVIEPLVEGYRWALPEFARAGLSNFFDNLSTPRILINDLLQGEFERAAESFARLTFNTTIGFGGFFDRASEMGIERHDEDFGQTLAVYGVEDSPYLVLPLLGPSNPRDAIGWAVDIALDPVNYLLFPLSLGANVTASTLEAFTRDPERLETMRRESLDFYTTLRDAYAQNRGHEIRNGAAPDDAELEELLSGGFDETSWEPAEGEAEEAEPY